MGEVTRIEGNEHSQQIRRLIQANERAKEAERDAHNRAIAQLNFECRNRQRRVLDGIGFQNLLLGLLVVIVIGNLLLDLYIHGTS